MERVVIIAQYVYLLGIRSILVLNTCGSQGIVNLMYISYVIMLSIYLKTLMLKN